MSADDALRMARNTGVKYYGFHTSCREIAYVIESYQDDGTQTRAETCMHEIILRSRMRSTRTERYRSLPHLRDLRMMSTG